MSLRVTTAALGVCVLCAGAARAGDAVSMESLELPALWRVTSAHHATAEQVMEFSSKLGGRVTSLANYKISAGRLQLGFNIVGCATEKDAKAVLGTLRSSGMPPEKFACRGSRVYELRYKDNGARAAHKMWDVLGLLPDEARAYRVTMQVAPLAGGDDAQWNDLFNALGRARNAPRNREAAEALEELAGVFDWSDVLVLPRWPKPKGGTTRSFSPEPVTRAVRGNLVVLTFGDLPRPGGVPRVDIEATITVRAFAPHAPVGEVDAERLTRATAAWPADHRAIDDVLAEIGLDAVAPTTARVERIHAWVYTNVTYGGRGVGTRWGTLRVLEQGFGRCWDLSDVVVSLCRRAGIPAREVGGWVHNGQGHVWAQAYDEAVGWVDVDATAPWLGVSSDYVPLWMSEDGPPPLVYAGSPELVPLGDE